MTNIGITGSRGFSNKKLVEDTIKLFNKDFTIISGACPNSPDAWAVDVAKQLNINYIEYPAKWRVNGVLNKRAGFERNLTIVQESDIVIAFWDTISSGCLDTINKSIKFKKPLLILIPADTAPILQEIMDRLNGID